MVFYDVYQNEISVESIRDALIQRYQETGTEVTDFEEGSEIYNLFTAYAYLVYDMKEQINDILLQTNVETADDEYLDTLAEQPNINLSRIMGAEAQGLVLFSLPQVLTTDFVIEDGLELVSGGVEFELDGDVTIRAGELTAEGTAIALEEGISGNIEAGTMELATPTELFTVTNPSDFSNGADYEEDGEFRDRIIANLQITNFGSKPYLEQQLLVAVPDIHDISILDCNCDYAAIIVPNTYKTGRQAIVNQQVQAYVDEPANVVAGQSFTVRAPTMKSLELQVGDAGIGSTGYYLQVVVDSTDMEDKTVEILTKYVAGGEVEGVGAPLEFNGLNINEVFDVLQIKTVLEEFSTHPVNLFFDGEEISQIELDGNEIYNITIVRDW